MRIEKICDNCHVTFYASNNRPTLCPECQLEKTRERKKKNSKRSYRKKHPVKQCVKVRKGCLGGLPVFLNEKFRNVEVRQGDRDCERDEILEKIGLDEDGEYDEEYAKEYKERMGFLEKITDRDRLYLNEVFSENSTGDRMMLLAIYRYFEVMSRPKDYDKIVGRYKKEFDKVEKKGKKLKRKYSKRPKSSA